jgi:hypothetical protein
MDGVKTIRDWLAADRMQKYWKIASSVRLSSLRLYLQFHVGGIHEHGKYPSQSGPEGL